MLTSSAPKSPRRKRTGSPSAPANSTTSREAAARLPAPARPVVMTARQPSFVVSAPASGIAMMEPIPRHSRSIPSIPSSICARAFAKGTSGAHAAMPIPATKKTMRVEICCACPGTPESLIMKYCQATSAFDTFMVVRTLGRMRSAKPSSLIVFVWLNRGRLRKWPNSPWSRRLPHCDRPGRFSRSAET